MLSQSCRTLSALHLGLRAVSIIKFSLKEHGNSQTRLCSITAITIISCGNVLLCNPVVIIHYSVHIKEFVTTFLLPYITEFFYQGFYWDWCNTFIWFRGVQREKGHFISITSVLSWRNQFSQYSSEQTTDCS